MTATDLHPGLLSDGRRRYRPDAPTPRRDQPRPPVVVAVAEPAATGPATEAWWDSLSVDARETARTVARCGGYLPAELSHRLVHAGVPILMPDDVRRYVQHQTKP